MTVKPPTNPTLRIVDLWGFGSGSQWDDLIDSSQVKFTYSGRGGIYQYLLALRKQRGWIEGREYVLVPAFQCPTVVDPILHAGFKVRFYAVTDTTEVNRADFLKKLDGTVAAAIFIRYFGFADIPAELAQATRAAGAKLVHDCSHSFLNAAPFALAGTQADAAIYSFWKLLPLSTVGGGVWCKDEAILSAWPKQTSALGHANVQLVRTLIGQMKDNLLQPHSRLDDVQGLAAVTSSAAVPVVKKSSDEAYPYDPQLSQSRLPAAIKILLNRADLAETASRRRQNFQAFTECLSASSEMLPIVRELHATDVPWGVPVILKKRGERDYLIRARGVPVFSFGEVLHPLLYASTSTDKEMVETAQYLSDNVLMFSIHQQLSVADVKHYAGVVNDYLSDLGR